MQSPSTNSHHGLNIAVVILILIVCILPDNKNKNNNDNDNDNNDSIFGAVIILSIARVHSVQQNGNKWPLTTGRSHTTWCATPLPLSFINTIIMQLLLLLSLLLILSLEADTH